MEDSKMKLKNNKDLKNIVSNLLFGILVILMVGLFSFISLLFILYMF